MDLTTASENLYAAATNAFLTGAFIAMAIALLVFIGWLFWDIVKMNKEMEQRVRDYDEAAERRTPVL